MALKIQNKYKKAVLTSLACTAVFAVFLIGYQILTDNAAEDRVIDELMTALPARLDKENEARNQVIADNNAEFIRDLLSVKYVLETAGEDEFFDKISQSGTFTSQILLLDGDGIVLNASVSPGLYIGSSIMELYDLIDDDFEKLLSSDGIEYTWPYTSKDGGLVQFFVAPTGSGDHRILMPVVLNGNYGSVYECGDMNGLFGYVDDRVILVPVENPSQKFGYFKVSLYDFTGHPISDLGFDRSVTLSPSSGRLRAFGYGFNYRTIQYSSDIFGPMTVIALRLDLGCVSVLFTIIALVSILLITFLLQLYCYYIDEEPGKIQMRVRSLKPVGKRGCCLDVEKTRVLLPFAAFGIVVVTLAGFYLHTLTLVSTKSWSCAWDMNNIAEAMNGMESKSKTAYDAMNEDAESFVKLIASVISDKESEILACNDASRLKTVYEVLSDGKSVPVRDAAGHTAVAEINNPWLMELADLQGASDLTIFDNSGNVVATSGTGRNRHLSRTESGYEDVFAVIDGFRSSCEFSANGSLYLAAPLVIRHNAAGDGDAAEREAVLLCRYDGMYMSSSELMLSSIKNTLVAAGESEECKYVMSVADENHRTIYCPESLGASSVADLNLSEEAFADEYVGFEKIHGEKYFIVTRKMHGSHNDYCLMSLVPAGNVYVGRMESTLFTFILTLLVIAVLLNILLIYGPDKCEALREEAEKDTLYRLSLDAVQLERLESEQRKEPTASQRIIKVLHKVWLAVLLVFSLCLIYGLMADNTMESLNSYLLSFAWKRGVNVFSITTMLLITFSLSFGMYLLKKLMSVLGNALNASAETICQLLVSLLRYAAYITIIFVTLYMFGVDTKGVLASLGAFSVMVGLGAKNLITDILAGISIIMEGDYKVGDIVNLGGFCGKVSEIGIRTTKVEDIEGNVKIFSNSAISGVINMTSKLSAVRMDVKISSRHRFEDIENEFTKFFDIIERRYPQIKGSSKYLGVQDSTPSYNIYRISVPCEEVDRAPLKRALLKDLSEFCAEENIEKM